MKSRLIASITHLAASIGVFALVVAWFYYRWFPGVFFWHSGGSELLILLGSVDVILGPLLTFAVCKPGKKGFLRDFSVIVGLQIAALGYGLYTANMAKPEILVFSRSGLMVVKTTEKQNTNRVLEAAGFPINELKQYSSRPAVVISDIAASNALDIRDDSFPEGAFPPELHLWSSLYRPYDAMDPHLEGLRQDSIQLTENQQKALDSYTKKAIAINIYNVSTGRDFGLGIVDRQSGMLLDMLPAPIIKAK